MMDHLGTARLPVMSHQEQRIWGVVATLADELHPEQWLLVGGQMVWLYAVWSGTRWPRVTHDVDMLANMELLAANLQACTGALHRTGFVSTPDSRGVVYRFRPRESPVDEPLVAIDLLAPDRIPQKLARAGGPVLRIEAGTQALQRAMSMTVQDADGRSFEVPVPGLLGAIVLKAAAWAVDSRNNERHAQDAAVLASIIDDAVPLISQLRGSDRGRLQRLGQALDDPRAEPWLLLDPERREVGFDNWRQLRGSR